ncbi:MAG: MOSC domain-containing protein [Spirochaetes bacterium]|nr:MOSC domain-containing protein [Spirochaetota bacterium]
MTMKNPNAVGRVVAVSISERKGMPKVNCERIELMTEAGIRHDAHAGPGHRQVSLLAMESIAKAREKMPRLRPGAFAENITSEFLSLPEIPVGTRFRMGAEALLEVTQIGKVCHKPCAIAFQTGDCVMPKEGIFARVLHGGFVVPGDPIELLPAALEAHGQTIGVPQTAPSPQGVSV